MTRKANFTGFQNLYRSPADSGGNTTKNANNLTGMVILLPTRVNYLVMYFFLLTSASYYSPNPRLYQKAEFFLFRLSYRTHRYDMIHEQEDNSRKAIQLI